MQQDPDNLYFSSLLTGPKKISQSVAAQVLSKGKQAKRHEKKKRRGIIVVKLPIVPLNLCYCFLVKKSTTEKEL